MEHFLQLYETVKELFGLPWVVLFGRLPCALFFARSVPPLAGWPGVNTAGLSFFVDGTSFKYSKLKILRIQYHSK
jgi:hypothetical protein